MILDSIEHLQRYQIPLSDKIISFIKTQDCLHLPDEEIAIDGRNLFVRVMSYHLKPPAENRFETHQIYTDLQYVVEGSELMQIADSKQLTPATEYDPQKDYQFFVSPGTPSLNVISFSRFPLSS